MTTTTTRNATLEDMAELLRAQGLAKLDLVVPATSIRSVNGSWVVAGADSEPYITPEGVMGMRPVPATFTPTGVADEHVSDKLGIPLAYVRKTRAERPDLYDANFNGWMHGRRKRRADGTEEVTYPGDARKFLVRAFRGSEGEPGVARALLSERYKMVDNLDVLVAALDGVREAGARVEVDGCDLSERRMYVRIVAPEVAALAPDLLAGYRSPWGGAAPWDRPGGREHGWLQPGDQPVVFAGFVISNSEVGDGAFTITPRIVVQACTNGLVVTRDVLRSIHLGGKLDEGIVRWTDDTQNKALALVTAQARDAVATFLDVEYVRKVVAEMTATATEPVSDAAGAVQVVTNRLRLSDAVAKSVLDHFILGGQMTVGGVAQAVSSVAQTLTDADAAADLEAAAAKVLLG